MEDIEAWNNEDPHIDPEDGQDDENQQSIIVESSDDDEAGERSKAMISQTISHDHAIQCLNDCLTYVETNNMGYEYMSPLVQLREKSVAMKLNAKKKQSNIFDYFQKI